MSEPVETLLIMVLLVLAVDTILLFSLFFKPRDRGCYKRAKHQERDYSDADCKQGRHGGSDDEVNDTSGFSECSEDHERACCSVGARVFADVRAAEERRDE